MFSSVTDDGAVEMRCASTDIGDLGDGNEDAWLMAYGEMGIPEAFGKLRGLISTGARSLLVENLLGDGAPESDASSLPEKTLAVRKMMLGGSSTMTLSCNEDLDRSARTELVEDCSLSLRLEVGLLML